jgi:hypothetical protein
VSSVGEREVPQGGVDSGLNAAGMRVFMDDEPKARDVLECFSFPCLHLALGVELQERLASY